MKVFFIGAIEFSKQALLKLIELNADIIGVATKERSEFNSDFANLSDVCVDNKVPYQYVTDINSKENIDWIKTLEPDIICCFGFSQLLSSELIKIPSIGVIGYHPAELPKNRGRHPLIWAMALGLNKTASTFFFIDEGVDTGEILSQKKIAIEYGDDAGSLYKKVINTALCQIEDFYPKLCDKSFVSVPQDSSYSNCWRKRGAKDGLIDFRMSSKAVYNLVRGLTRPYVGADIEYKGQKRKVWKVKEVELETHNIEPGKVLSVNNDRPIVKCYDNAVELIEHEFCSIPEVGEYL